MTGALAPEMDSLAIADHHYSRSTLFYVSAKGSSQEAPFEHISTNSSSLRDADAQAAGCRVPDDVDFKLDKEVNGQICTNFGDADGFREQRNGFLYAMSCRTELETMVSPCSRMEQMGEMSIRLSGRCKADGLDSFNGRCCGTACCSEMRPATSQCEDGAAEEQVSDNEDRSKEQTNGRCSRSTSNGSVLGYSNTEITEASELDISQYFSAEEWGSQSSTASPASTSAPPSLFSPGFNRSQTAPLGACCNLNVDENYLLFSRCHTEKRKESKHLEGFHKNLSPAEKLSERKRKKIIEKLVTIQKDGTVEVHVDRSDEIAPTLFDLDVSDQVAAHVEGQVDSTKAIPVGLNIAMLIVGTRGDVQPFLAIGKRLQKRGHRVRLATHANFREFVVSNGLEFFPLGGDPKVLAGYMVKNKGFLPSGPSEISIQKRQLKAIMNSLLPACTEPDGESGASFKAGAIIANPPAYGHVHVAEYLDVPLHIFFTMPWTPTNEFPHPLARVKKQAAYKISYLVVDSLMWWGMRGLINEFRMKKLHLTPMTYFNTNQGSIAHLPIGYIWSPHLVPKPKDWGPRVDVVGFCSLSLANGYKPPEDLVNWLQAGEKPIYVGFGSLPLEDPGRMTAIIVKALQETNQRGIIDKGWGGLGNLKATCDNIFLLENCPHDWLFPQCAAVVHHGGAGTTAAGLKAGCPTTIVPFFGDQPFWGERVHTKGVGPLPIPVQQFSLERLVHAVTFMLDAEVKQRALDLAKQLQEEDGVEGAVDAFYRHWVPRSSDSSSTVIHPSWVQTILSRIQILNNLKQEKCILLRKEARINGLGHLKLIPNMLSSGKTPFNILVWE